MSVTLSQADEKGLSVLSFNPPVYCACDASQTDLVLKPDVLAQLIAVLEAEQASLTGDANTPWQDEMDDPKTDERKTEAWLDS